MIVLWLLLSVMCPLPAPLSSWPTHQSTALAAREEKAIRQRDNLRQQASDLSELQQQLANQAEANSQEANRLQAMAEELQQGQAAVAAREAAAASAEQQLAAEAAELQQHKEELKAQIAEVQVGDCTTCYWSLVCPVNTVTPSAPEPGSC